MLERFKKIPSHSARFAWLIGVACAACCSIPLIAIALGSASVGALAFYSEKLAIVIAALGIGFLLFKLFARRKAPSCNIICGCRPESEKQNSSNTK